MKEISIAGLLEDLSNGLTRTKEGKGYNATLGSIEEKYELTKAEVKDIFKHPLLANKKTKAPRTFLLVDDVTPSESNTAPAYGARPETSNTLPTAAAQLTETQQDSGELPVNLGQENLA
tara:strand:+ start:215 stop:571 length:357 start_codon:yes stop_codon:yes gene_type:complete